MKTATSIKEISDELSMHFRKKDIKIIGIDGKDGSGKSYLANAISEKLEIGIICLDKFIEQQKGAYVKYLDVDAISMNIQSMQTPLIIEGVCLLAATKLLNIKVDIHIYVKRMNTYGVWLDEEECDSSTPPGELISKLTEELRKLTKLTAIMNGETLTETKNSEVNFPKLAKEIIQYHFDYHPITNADYIFERIEI